MARSPGGTKGRSERKYPTIAVCGLDCGFCPRYYTQGKSRCPGCGGPDFSSKHPSCSFITCCVKEKGLEVCAECPEFPCSKFRTDEEYQREEGSSSYPSPKPIMRNLRFIREHGISAFAAEQGKRIALLQRMIDTFDDGRSRSFFCRAACLHDPAEIESAVNEAVQTIEAEGVGQDDKKRRARILRGILDRRP